MRRLDREVAAAEEAAGIAPSGAGEEPPPSPTPSGRAQDPAAKAVAASFFAAFARGDVSGMLAGAGYPFRSLSGVAASDRGELQGMLKGLVDESSSRSLRRLEVHTSAGIRRALGRLPPGLDDGSGLLFALAETGEATYILLISPHSGGWRATGLFRR
jgi:hypothetical protein